MHTVFGGLKLAGCWFLGMGVGTLADVMAPISPDTHIPIGTAVGVGVSCVMAAMWLSRRLTRLEDGQKELRDGQQQLKEGQSAMQQSFGNLPCHNWRDSDCPPPKKHK